MNDQDERFESLMKFTSTLIDEKIHWLERAVKAERILAFTPMLLVFVPVVFLFGYLLGARTQ